MLSWLKSRFKSSVPVLTPELAGLQQADWLIVYASQSGKAKKLAEQTAEQLAPAKVALVNLGEIKPADLVFFKRILFIVATFGDGRAPDPALPFAKKMSKALVDLSQLNFGLVGLGNRQYDVFCAFGKSLDTWLVAHQGQPLFESVWVDQMDKQSISEWFEAISQQCGPGHL